MTRFLYSLIVPLLMVLEPFQGVKGQSVCGHYEEGTGQGITCTTKTPTFSRYGPRIEINQTYEEMSYCDSNGNCHDNDPTRFKASFIHDTVRGRKNVTLRISSVTRDMKTARCYSNGFPIFGVICSIYVYIKPNKPICTGPEFVDDGRAALITCTSDRVYPEATCGLHSQARNESLGRRIPGSVTDNLTSSLLYPGDKKLTCWFKLHLTGVAENSFKFTVQFHARVPQYQPSTVQADPIPDLDLRATTLDSTAGTSRRVTADYDNQELRVNIPVISNPPPFNNSFVLSLSHSESSIPVAMLSQQFSTRFSRSAGSDVKGTVELTVSTREISGQKRFNFFTFTASNGLAGKAPFSDKFTWTRLNIPPTQPTCDAPEFVDDGASALFLCTADRVYPMGTCDFRLINTSLRLNKQAVMRTETGNSIAYPGEKKVTCKLQLPVVGNMEGAYQFQVQITPSLTAGNQSVFATTAALSLGATKLYSTPKDDKVYDYPESGDLAISFPVTGNPVPKTVTLWVRHSNTEMAPVSSGNFRWTYDKQAGTNFGHVNVFVLKTVLGENVIRNYTLKVDNGVVGLSEFEYNFAVMGNMEPPTVPICDSPVFINGGATAKISCTSDRLAPSFKWEFTLTSESGHLQDWSKEERCQVEDSTAYPGLKKSICGLQVSVIGSSAGDYWFKVKITSILDAQEGNVLSAEKLTPVVSLNPTTLLNFEDNNHIFKYPQSGQLAIDVYVKGNPEPTNVRLWVRQSDASGTVPVSSQNFRWTYQKTAGAVQSGVIQLTISGGLEDGEISSYTLKAENGVVSESEFEYKFSVNGMDIKAAAAVSEKQNNLPVIAGSAAGGLVLLLIIIVMIIFVLRKRRNVQNSGSDYNTAQHIGEFDPPYIYPNKGFSPDGGNREEESQYSKLPSPYLVPMPERPMSNYSLPEYSEIYDTPKKDNQQD